MRGDFSLQDVGEGRGPYLAFLYWRGRDTWNATVLCAWRRRSGWPYVLATCVAVAVAAWQTHLAARSMSGQSWDPVFHGIKLSALAAVMIVDLAAAAVLLRARSRLSRSGRAGTNRTARLPAGFALLIVAAILYVASFPWLATTGE